MLYVALICGLLVAGSSSAFALSLIDEAHINEIEKLRPDIAETINERLNEIEQSNATDEQKQQARDRLLDRQIRNAETAKKAAEQFGNNEKKAEAQQVLELVNSLKRQNFAGSGSTDDLPQSVKIEIVRLTKEKKKQEADANRVRTFDIRVTDKNGAPLIGAGILIVGTSQGTVTDIDGNGKLEVRGKDCVKVRVSYTGFEPLEVDICIDPDETKQTTIELKPAFSAPDQIVVPRQPEPDLRQSSSQTEFAPMPVFTMTANARTGMLDRGKASRLRTELGGMVTNERFGPVDRNDFALGLDTTLQLNLDPRPILGKQVGLSPFVGFSSFDAGDTTRIDFLSANGDQTALLGPQGPGGPLGGGLVTAAGFGDVENVRYSDDYDEFILRFGLSGKVRFDSGITLEPRGSFFYGTTDERSSFSGYTNLGTVDFAYMSETESDRYGLELGTRLSFPLGDAGFGMFVDGAVRFIHNEASGYTSFDAGFNGAPVPAWSELQHYSKDKFDVGGLIGGGLTYDNGPISAFAGVTLETWQIPVVQVTGEVPAFIDYDDRFSVEAKFGMKISF
jgi:ribosomal protein S8